MRTYLVEVRHDKGTIVFQVVAVNRKALITMVTKAENCPASAIAKIIHLKKGVKEYAD